MRLDQCRRLLGWPEPLGGFIVDVGFIGLLVLIRVLKAATDMTLTAITAPAKRQGEFDMKLFLEDM